MRWGWPGLLSCPRAPVPTLPRPLQGLPHPSVLLRHQPICGPLVLPQGLLTCWSLFPTRGGVTHLVSPATGPDSLHDPHFTDEQLRPRGATGRAPGPPAGAVRQLVLGTGTVSSSGRQGLLSRRLSTRSPSRSPPYASHTLALCQGPAGRPLLSLGGCQGPVLLRPVFGPHRWSQGPGTAGSISIHTSGRFPACSPRTDGCPSRGLPRPVSPGDETGS